MNGVDEFRHALSRELPAAIVQVDAPDTPTAAWWLDVSWNELSATVEWRPKVGYGVSGEPGAYGEGAEYIYNSAEAAAHAIADLLRNQQPDRVLLVTSDSSVQDQLTKQLRRRNLTVVTVADASAAGEQVKRNIFDLIIVDLQHLDDKLTETIRLVSSQRGHTPITFVVGVEFKDVPSDIVHAVLRPPIPFEEVATMAQLAVRLKHERNGDFSSDDETPAAFWLPAM